MRDYPPEMQDDTYALLSADPEYAAWCVALDAAQAAEEARLYREREAAWAKADLARPAEVDAEPCPF